MPHITNLPTHEEAAEALAAGNATALHRFIHDQEPAGPTEEEFREELANVLDEARAELSPATASPIEAIQLVCDALTAIVANSGDPAGTVNALAPWRARAETFIQNHGKPQEAMRQPTSACQSATDDKAFRDALNEAVAEQLKRNAATRLAGALGIDSLKRYCSTTMCGGISDMMEAHYGDFVKLSHVLGLLATVPQPAQVEQPKPGKWQPIETATADGRTILLGHFNSHGKWRTMRGQWFTKEHIEDNWEDGDLFEAGWYETSVEADDAPSCWPTKPTHWQPLPPAPTQEAGARLAAKAKGGE